MMHDPKKIKFKIQTICEMFHRSSMTHSIRDLVSPSTLPQDLGQAYIKVGGHNLLVPSALRG